MKRTLRIHAKKTTNNTSDSSHERGLAKGEVNFGIIEMNATLADGDCAAYQFGLIKYMVVDDGEYFLKWNLVLQLM